MLILAFLEVSNNIKTVRSIYTVNSYLKSQEVLLVLDIILDYLTFEELI